MGKNMVYSIERNFCKILQQKEFRKITVSEICSKAGISRSSFYTYFESTRQLFTDVEEYILDDVMHILKKYDSDDVKSLLCVNTSPLFLDICKYYHKNIEIFRALFGTYGEDEFIFIYESHMYQDFLKKARVIGGFRFPEFIASGCAGAIIAISRSWALDTDLATPEEMAGLQTAIVFRMFFSEDRFSEWMRSGPANGEKSGKEEYPESRHWNWNTSGKLFGDTV